MPKVYSPVRQSPLSSLTLDLSARYGPRITPADTYCAAMSMDPITTHQRQSAIEPCPTVSRVLDVRSPNQRRPDFIQTDHQMSVSQGITIVAGDAKYKWTTVGWLSKEVCPSAYTAHYYVLYKIRRTGR